VQASSAGVAAPIAFFAFNRPEHAAISLAALATNPLANSSTIVCFVDGPRNERDAAAVSDVARICRQASGFGRVEVRVAGANQGLFRAITSGVSAILESEDCVIVVEDDVVVTEHFLAYMNEALLRYRDADAVGSVHAYSPPLKELPAFFFLPGADCWGWATWADRWRLFDSDAAALLRVLSDRALLEEFSRSHGFESLMMLAKRAQGRSQSWAILWHASLFLAGKLTLHPGSSFVRNIGNDGTGVNARASSDHESAVGKDYAGLPDLQVSPDFRAAQRLAKFLDGGRLPEPLASARRLAVRIMALRTARHVVNEPFK
jgi:hypothetical protein